MVDEGIIYSAVGDYASSYGGEIAIHIEDLNERRLTVRFEGRMCKTCGVSGYFEGLAYMLKISGIDARIAGYRQEGGGYVVEYLL